MGFNSLKQAGRRFYSAGQFSRVPSLGFGNKLAQTDAKIGWDTMKRWGTGYGYKGAGGRYAASAARLGIPAAAIGGTAWGLG